VNPPIDSGAKASVRIYCALRKAWDFRSTQSPCCMKLTAAELEWGDVGRPACTVLLNGETVNSRLGLTIGLEGRETVAIEGLGDAAHSHSLQQALIDHAAVQRGFWTPYMVVAAEALLEKHPNPTERQIREGMAGNLCRCTTGYLKFVESVKRAAALL